MRKAKKGPATSSLGRALVKDKSKRNRGKSSTEGWLHTTELADGYDWGRLNLQSVTEESDLNEFLSTAKLAGTEFTAEKLNISFVTEDHNSGLPSAEEREAVRVAQEEHKQFLSVPRRPQWDSSTTPEELARREQDSFWTWRRNLAKLQENEKLILTPFEKNLDFWRQLWRVIERSDVVVQIVDARNPLLFQSEDLVTCVKELCSTKENMLLLSKADLLTPLQREIWADYFEKEGIAYAFWSAHLEAAKFEVGSSTNDDQAGSVLDDTDTHQEMEVENEGGRFLPPAMARSFMLNDECAAMATVDESTEDRQHGSKPSVGVDETVCSDTSSTTEERMADDVAIVTQPPISDDTTPQCEAMHSSHDATRDEHAELLQEDDVGMSYPSNNCGTSVAGVQANGELNTIQSCDPAHVPMTVNPKAKLLTCDELLKLFRSLCCKEMPRKDQESVVVGMVGYPNVGKSSTINALIQGKKVPVSATPGRTKHFQTLFAADNILLCDCPGLVFPSFISTKAEMVCSGILSIDQMRDYLGPVSLLCHRIPRHVLEATYGILLPKPKEGEDSNRSVYASELLNAYGYVRGYMTAHGQPDCSRASRYILKDYVMGKLLYCFPPPGFDQSRHFNPHLIEHGSTETSRVSGDPVQYDPSQDPILPTVTNPSQVNSIGTRNPDALFLYQEKVNVHSKGQVAGAYSLGHYGNSVGGQETQDHVTKPWKKHHNKDKNQKIKCRVKKVIEN